jgi:endonuclease/exonuclease/phosphatase family metal-dependent hydrolase
MQIGNAILSRWPITKQTAQPLPAGAADGRTVLFARVQTPTGPVPFFTTQLTSTIGQSAVRCRQVAALCQFVAAHLDPGFRPWSPATSTPNPTPTRFASSVDTRPLH